MKNGAVVVLEYYRVLSCVYFLLVAADGAFFPSVLNIGLFFEVMFFDCCGGCAVGALMPMSVFAAEPFVRVLVGSFCESDLLNGSGLSERSVLKEFTAGCALEVSESALFRTGGFLCFELLSRSYMGSGVNDRIEFTGVCEVCEVLSAELAVPVGDNAVCCAGVCNCCDIFCVVSGFCINGNCFGFNRATDGAGVLLFAFLYAGGAYCYSPITVGVSGGVAVLAAACVSAKVGVRAVAVVLRSAREVMTGSRDDLCFRGGFDHIGIEILTADGALIVLVVTGRCAGGCFCRDLNTGMSGRFRNARGVAVSAGTGISHCTFLCASCSFFYLRSKAMCDCVVPGFELGVSYYVLACCDEGVAPVSKCIMVVAVVRS